MKCCNLALVLGKNGSKGNVVVKTVKPVSKAGEFMIYFEMFAGLK